LTRPNQIIAEMRTRMQTGGEVTSVLAEFHTLLAGQSVPEWFTVAEAAVSF
jgi:hypothetical protein